METSEALAPASRSASTGAQPQEVHQQLDSEVTPQESWRWRKQGMLGSSAGRRYTALIDAVPPSQRSAPSANNHLVLATARQIALERCIASSPVPAARFCSPVGRNRSPGSARTSTSTGSIDTVATSTSTSSDTPGVPARVFDGIPRRRVRMMPVATALLVPVLPAKESGVPGLQWCRLLGRLERLESQLASLAALASTLGGGHFMCRQLGSARRMALA